MSTEPSERTAQIARYLTQNSRFLQIASLALTVLSIGTIVLFRNSIANIDAVGYPGVFFISALGSGSILLPVPSLISICGASLFLSPFAVGLVGAAGETLGELTGYALGYGGQGIVEEGRFYGTAKRWMQRRGTLVLFVVSAIPNPFFDVVGITAGATGYPLKRFLVTVLAGRSVKGLMTAYTCFYGFQSLPWVS